ncbi:hypothetical protein FRC01_004184 [Tulasnella sp. 417]|nr:hypothetical protein FRC01_004184 [Tulasnella sp. 417]
MEPLSATSPSAIVHLSIAAAGYPPTPITPSKERTSLEDGGPASMHGRQFYNIAWHLVRNPESRNHLNTLPMSPYGRKDLQRLVLSISLVPEQGHGPVRDLRFSPDGKWLGASFDDGTAGAWKVDGNKFIWHYTVAARAGPIVWSPDSRFLLVKTDGGLIRWCPETKTHRRMLAKELDAYTWGSDGEHFMAVAGQFLWIVNKETGQTERDYVIPSRPMRVHDIASVPRKAEGGGG